MTDADFRDRAVIAIAASIAGSIQSDFLLRSNITSIAEVAYDLAEALMTQRAHLYPMPPHSPPRGDLQKNDQKRGGRS